VVALFSGGRLQSSFFFDATLHWHLPFHHQCCQLAIYILSEAVAPLKGLYAIALHSLGFSSNTAQKRTLWTSTVLRLASVHGNPEASRVLEDGVDVNARDDYDTTASRAGNILTLHGCYSSTVLMFMHGTTRVRLRS
jgi:hypothetical protein